MPSFARYGLYLRPLELLPLAESIGGLSTYRRPWRECRLSAASKRCAFQPLDFCRAGAFVQNPVTMVVQPENPSKRSEGLASL